MSESILGDRYQILQQLSQQAGRQTLLVRDLHSSELVVIKLLSLGVDFDWQSFELFEREAQTLKKLSHPSIPRYLDYLEIDTPNDKQFAIAQRYVEGKTLEEHLRTGRTFSQLEVRQIAKSLLEILIYLHYQQLPIVHRDIKPSNIIVSDRSGHSVGQVYLIDFGSVANLAATEGGTITVVGTYGYMPPEQFSGRAIPASDLYSLGATLIYLVTGRHPTELPQKNFQIQFRELTNLDSLFARWLEWMTQPSWQRRPSSAQQALQALIKPRYIPQLAKKTPEVIYQPPESQVKLRKSDDCLSILMPGKKLYFPLIFWFLLSITIGLVFGFWVDNQFLEYGEEYKRIGLSFISYLVSICIIISFFAGTLRYIFAIWGKVQFCIDSKNISLTYELFGRKWSRLQVLRQKNISDLKIHLQPFDFPVTAYIPTVDNSKLFIQLGKQRYALDWNLQSTEDEIKWLAYEIEEWLERSRNNMK